MSELRKLFLKKIKSRKLKKQNQCQIATYQQKTTNEKWKFGSNKKTRPRMYFELITKTLYKKNPIQKIEKQQISE